MTPLQKRSLHALVAALGFAIGLVASGCLDSTATCTNNLKACGTTCADVSSDKANCGACGNACALGQVCQSGGCVCESGTQACGGACVVTQSDPANCGACGNACPTGQVCEAGACKTSCTLGSSTTCNGACVDEQSDPNNCGACGHVCATAQACVTGSCTYQGDVVAACFNAGTLVAISPTSTVVGEQKPVGTNPNLVAAEAPVVFEGDVDGLLRQVRQGDLSTIGTGTTLGTDPEGLLSVAPYLYAIDDSSNALTVFSEGDAGTLDAGFALTAVGGYSFGSNSGARSPALDGHVLYVPLFGNLFGGAPGTSVATVDVTNPASPQDAGVIDLSSLDLHSFDGGTAYPQPSSAAVFNGKVYVALNNLDPNYAAAGPGLLAKIDPADGGVTEVALGADACLEPYALKTVGDKLVVSCAGETTYNPPDYTTSSTQKSALVLVDGNDQRVGVYSATCPADAGCQDPSLGNLAVVGQRVFAADQSAGRVFVADVSDAGFTEVRGYGVDGGPLTVCVGADGGTSGQLVSGITAFPAAP